MIFMDNWMDGIDMQVDFCSPGGYVDAMGYDLSLMRAAVDPIATVLTALRKSSWLVFHTREGHRHGKSFPNWLPRHGNGSGQTRQVRCVRKRRVLVVLTRCESNIADSLAFHSLEFEQEHAFGLVGTTGKAE